MFREKKEVLIEEVEIIEIDLSEIELNENDFGEEAEVRLDGRGENTNGK